VTFQTQRVADLDREFHTSVDVYLQTCAELGKAPNTPQPRQPDLIPVERLEHIPAFADEDEEDQCWGTHRLGDALLDQMQPVPPEGDEWAPPAWPRVTRSVPLRLGDDVVARAKVLAAKRNTGYQTLLKEFVIERLYEEEKRSGLR
jgi:hypothetical protein